MRKGSRTFVKFHWSPKAGTHSLVWDEAVKISGADSDFHRRDLWEAIEAGAYPEWELAVQTFSERDAERYSFDVLDATKIVPEELVPLTPIGRMVLDRNPDNFFAETEQVAFCTAHIVPGIDFSNDPLLAGRIHSYVDTQISRLGGPNFHEIPINAPIAQVHNNQRDGMHRQAIPRGRVAYEPNSLAGGCPFQGGRTGFTSFPQEIEEHKVRGKPEKFAEHYNQATLFWNSQSDVEKTHIVNAFRFELTKVQTVAIRTRMLAGLRNVAAELAETRGEGVGTRVARSAAQGTEPQAAARDHRFAGAVAARSTGRGGHQHAPHRDPRRRWRRRRQRDAAARRPCRAWCRAAFRRRGSRASADVRRRRDRRRDFARNRPIGPLGRRRIARRRRRDQGAIAARAGHGVREGSIPPLQADLGARRSAALLEGAGIWTTLPSGEKDAGVIHCEEGDARKALDVFVEALAKHRHFDRETIPPRV